MYHKGYSISSKCYLWHSKNQSPKNKKTIMKHSAYLILAACMLASCQNEGKHTVTGEMTDLAGDTLMIYSREAGTDNEVRLDTVVAKNGKFVFDTDNTVMQEIIISVQDDMSMTYREVEFLLLPGHKVRISGQMSDPVFAGGTFYEDMNTVRNIQKEYNSKIDSIFQVCYDMEDKGIDEDSIRKVYQPAEELTRQMDERLFGYISSNPSKDISVYLLPQLSHENMRKSIELIDEKVKSGIMAPYYNYMKADFDKEEKRLEAEKNIQPGKPAPDFTLKDINGKDFTLSSLKGKYVVLDFWGSWCVWCIKGIPAMKEVYEKYNGKVEFVGIDCRDTEEKWREAVKEHGMPWINVRNDENSDVVSQYAIQGFPTKIIIDKEGKIVEVVVGESPEFYDSLKKILDK